MKSNMHSAMKQNAPDQKTSASSLVPVIANPFPGEKRGGDGISISGSTSKKKQVTLVSTAIDVEKSEVALARNTSAKQQIFGGSLYSKALLHGSKDTVETLTLHEALKFLEGTQYLFFKKCKTFPPELSTFNPRNKRGIWNSSGRVVYYTGEKSSYYCKCCLYSGFNQEVVDYRGKTVIVSQGRQMIFGWNSYVEIYLGDEKLLGSMQQSCLSSTYEIKDPSGRVIYKIQAPCFAPCAPFVFWCCKEHFEICMDDGITDIGMITKYWDEDIAVQEFMSCVGLEMDRVADVRVKALLLGCFFLIEFQYYRNGGNGPIYFIIMLMIFTAAVLGSDCLGYCPHWYDGIGQTLGITQKNTIVVKSSDSVLDE